MHLLPPYQIQIIELQIIPVRKKRNQIEDEESDAEDEGSEAEEAEEETNNENGESEADMSIVSMRNNY